MKTVCKQVYAKYPDFDLTDKKDFIKATVKAVSELPWHSPNIIIHYFAFLSVNCDIDYAETKALVKPGEGPGPVDKQKHTKQMVTSRSARCLPRFSKTAETEQRSA